ncbi:MAG: AAA family ATPase [Candidatus Saccharimonadales bacterium]
MKSLSTSRPLVLLIVGVPGAGKSHFARQFATIFHTPLVSYDKLQNLLFTEPKFSKEEELLIANIMNSQIQELFKTQRTFIVDGAVNSRAARMEIEKSARKNDYGTLTIWIQTDHESAQSRVMSRNKRREGDLYNARMSAEQFKKHAQRINPPAVRELYTVISGKHTFATQAKVVLKKIVTPREAIAVPIQRVQSASGLRTSEGARIVSS